MKYYQQILLFSSCLIILNNCTENPLFDSSIQLSEDTVIKGSVQLKDDDTSSGIYVWLEGFDLSTHTGSDGSFSIELPEPSTQPGGGLSGIYRLYYYCANYQIQHSSIVLLNGKIEPNQGDVTNKGKISPVVSLKKILSIRTEVNPSAIQTTYNENLITNVYLNNQIDTVHVRTYLNIFGNISGLVITREGGDADHSLMIRGTQSILIDEFITDPTVWYIGYKFSPNYFDAGNYLFSPIIEIVQEDIPLELLNSIGDEIYGFSLEYLKIPIKQTHGLLSVTPAED